MILVDQDIMSAQSRGEIVVEPWDEECLGTNSYDVHLGPTLLTYDQGCDEWHRPQPLDCRKRAATRTWLISDDGFVLQPGELYLASTVEYTESNRHVPILNGKSSLGRLGLSIHVTAGTGDVGFKGHWTMELFVIKPLRVYAGMAVGQLLWFKASSKPDVSYEDKPSAKYCNHSPFPGASEMAANFK